MPENLGDAVLELRTDNSGLRSGMRAGEREVNSSLQRVSAGIIKHRRAIGAGMIATGAAVAGGAFVAVKAFAGFEQSIARAGALAGANAEELEQFSDVAKRLGRTTQFSARDAAGALAFLSQAGFEVTESTKALPGVLELAAAASLDLATSADITSNVLSGYGFQVEDLTRVNDVLTKAFTSANTDLQQLGQALKFAGPVASAAGISFEEATAAIASMGNAGIQASMAGTSLRGAITRLLNPVGEASDILEELGVNVLDSSGKMNPLVDIIAQLEKGGLTAADAMVVFGQRAGPAMLALVQQGSESLREFTGELENSGGVAGEIAQRQMETFQGSIIRLKSTLEGLAIVIGGLIGPALESIISKVQPIIGFIAEWAERHKTLASVLAIVTLAIGALLLGGGAVLLMLPLLTAGFTAMGVAVTFATGPIGIIIVAIAALTAAAITLWRKWDEIWDKIGGAVEAAVNFMIGIFNKWSFVQRKVLAGMIRMAKAFLDALPGANALGDEMQAAINKIEAGIPTLDIHTKKVEAIGEVYTSTGAKAQESAEVQEIAATDAANAVIAQEQRVSTNLTEQLEARSVRRTEAFIKDQVEAAKARSEEREAEAQWLAERLERGVLLERAVRQAKRESNQEILRNLRARHEEERLANERAAAAAIEQIERQNRSFEDMTQRLQFQFSSQGQAWDSLGGNVESVIEAIQATTGRAALDIIDGFESMRMEGEQWRELLLRLDSDGTISLGNLAQAMDKLREEAEKAQDEARKLASAVGVDPKITENTIAQQAGTFASRIAEARRAGLPTAELEKGLAQLTAPLREGVNSFKHGGVVPGPEGAPRLAVVHGGETIGGGGSSPAINFNAPVFGFEDFERRVASIAVRQQRRGALDMRR